MSEDRHLKQQEFYHRAIELFDQETAIKWYLIDVYDLKMFMILNAFFVTMLYYIRWKIALPEKNTSNMYTYTLPI